MVGIFDLNLKAFVIYPLNMDEPILLKQGALYNETASIWGCPICRDSSQDDADSVTLLDIHPFQGSWEEVKNHMEKCN